MRRNALLSLFACLALTVAQTGCENRNGDLGAGGSNTATERDAMAPGGGTAPSTTSSPITPNEASPAQPSIPASPATPNQSGTSIKAPGVDIESGPGGTSVRAPGTKVDSGPGGTTVDAPGTKVDVNKGSNPSR